MIITQTSNLKVKKPLTWIGPVSAGRYGKIFENQELRLHGEKFQATVTKVVKVIIDHHGTPVPSWEGLARFDLKNPEEVGYLVYQDPDKGCWRLVVK